MAHDTKGPQDTMPAQIEPTQATPGKEEKPLKNIALSLVMSALLAGCAGSPIGNLINNERSETRNDVLASWVGEDEDNLVMKWGPPTGSYTLSSGAKVISYEYVWGVYVGQRYHCEEKFLIEKGKVTKWGIGSACQKSGGKGQTLPANVPVPQPTL